MTTTEYGTIREIRVDVAGDERTPLLERTDSPLPLRATIESWSTFEKITALACMALLILGVAIGTYLLARQNEWYPTEFELIHRVDWEAATATNSSSEKLSLPVLKVLLLETNTSSCLYTKQCKKIVRRMQKDHVENDEEDIAYNFLVAGDGKIYEGRGWKYESPLASDDEQLVIAFLGKFEDDGPGDEQVDALKAFLDYSVSKNYLAGCYEVIVRYSPKRYLVDVAQKLSNSIRRDKDVKCYF